MLFSRLVLAAAVMAFHGTAWSHDYKVHDIEIDDLWVRATAPGQPAGGGYLKIHNVGDKSDQLIGIKSDAAGDASIHQTITKNGVSTMREVDGGVAIPAKAEVEFMPGGYHVMFMKLKGPFKEGMEIPATLTFRNAGTIDVKFKVMPLTYQAPSGNGHMNHGDMGGMNMGNMKMNGDMPH